MYKMDIKPSQFVFTTLISAAMFAGCGGGSGSKEQTITTPMSSVSFASANVVERNNVSLTATLSNIENASSYQWQVTSGHEVTLNNADTATVNFDAPSINDDTRVSISLVVTDNSGQQYNASGYVDVSAIKHHIELSGTLTDLSLNNESEITLLLGGEVTTNKATINGQQYDLSVELDEDDYMHGVTLQLDSGNASHLTAYTHLGNVQELSNLTKQKEITSANYYVADISPLSTALYLMQSVQQESQILQSKVELDKTLDILPLYDILNLSKIIYDIHSNDSIAAGNGYNVNSIDITNLVANNEGLSLLVNDMREYWSLELGENNASHLLQLPYEATNAIEFDKVIYETPSRDSIVPLAFNINEDASGYFGEQTFTWLESENSLQLTLNSPIIRTDFNENTITTKGYELTKLFSSESYDWVLKTTLRTLKAPGYGVSHTIEKEHNSHTIIKTFKSVSSVAMESFEVDKTYHMPIISACLDDRTTCNNSLKTERVKITSANSAYFESLNVNANMQTTDSETTFSFVFNGKDKTLSYSPLASTELGTVYAISGHDLVEHHMVTQAGYIKQEKLWDVDNIPGIYSFKAELLNDYFYNWIELEPNGNALFANVRIGANGPEYDIRRYGTWSIDENNNVHMVFYRDISYNNIICREEIEGVCVKDRTRVWQYQGTKDGSIKIRQIYQAYYVDTGELYFSSTINSSRFIVEEPPYKAE